jgi:hypothetical protein
VAGSSAVGFWIHTPTQPSWPSANSSFILGPTTPPASAIA